MLLAIDVGNSNTVFGLYDDRNWIAVWRKSTRADETEDELASWLYSLLSRQNFDRRIDAVVCASVVPSFNATLDQLCRKWLKCPLQFLSGGLDFGLTVLYSPAVSVGADRLANALGALDQREPPIIVVDFGTGTNFDVIDAEGRYVGGAIMPGITVGSEALFRKAAKLPHVDGLSLKPPPHAIGSNTVESLQSGIVLGYAFAIDGLVEAMAKELGTQPTAVATGGLGQMFTDICTTLESYEPNLTLDGLRIAHQRIRS